MSMTIEMLVARIETLETQIASLFKEQGTQDKKAKKEAKKSNDEVLEDPEVVVAKKKTKKESKNTDTEVLDDTEVVVVKKVKKAKKVKDDTSSDDEDKPKKKKGTNGYILFSNANRDDVKAKLFVGDEKPKNTEIMKQLAELWQSTSAEEKEVWNAKAKEANEVN